MTKLKSTNPGIKDAFQLSSPSNNFKLHSLCLRIGRSPLQYVDKPIEGLYLGVGCCFVDWHAWVSFRRRRWFHLASGVKSIPRRIFPWKNEEKRLILKSTTHHWSLLGSLKHSYAFFFFFLPLIELTLIITCRRLFQRFICLSRLGTVSELQE